MGRDRNPDTADPAPQQFTPEKATPAEPLEPSRSTPPPSVLNDFMQQASGLFKQMGRQAQDSDLARLGFAPARILPNGQTDGAFLFFGPPDEPGAQNKGEKAEGKGKGKDRVESKGDEKGEEKRESDRDKEKTSEAASRMTRSDLTDLAKQRLGDGKQLSSFLTDVGAFEKRAEKDKLTQADKEKFYRQVGDVLEASKTGNKFFNGDELKTIASDMVKEAAKPGSVNQGPYGTCTAAALQSALFKAEPAAIGGLVRELAVNGEYKTTDGSTIKPNPKNLKPDQYHTEQTPYSRNSVDQIAQVGLLNVFWQRRAGLDGKDPDQVGKLSYEEGHPRDFLGDTRTRLMDSSSGKPRPLTEEHTFIDSAMKRSEDAPLFESSERRPIEGPRILDMANIHDMYSQLQGNKGTLKVISGGGSDPVFKPKSAEELKDYIEKARKDNGGVLPAVVVGVFTNVEPFATDVKDAFYKQEKDKGSEPDAAQLHGHHAVALFDFDSSSDKSIIENQWGHNVDHTGKPGSKPPVALGDLYQAIKGKAPEKKEESEKEEPKEDKKEKKYDAEKSAREYIDEYKKMVDELSADPDADPLKVFGHREKLLSYLNSWDRRAEAKQEQGKLADQVAKFLRDGNDMSLKDGMDSYAQIAKNLQKDGQGEKGREISTALQSRLAKEIDKLGGKGTDGREQFNTLDLATQALKTFKDLNDKTGAAKVIERLKAAADTRREQSGSANTDGFDLTRKVIDTLQEAGFKKEAAALLSSALSDLKKMKPDSKQAELTSINAKMDMVASARSIGKEAVARTLNKEMESSFEKMKKEDRPIDDEARSRLRFALSMHYMEEKQGDKLIPLVNENIANSQARIEKDTGGKADDNKRFITPLTMSAERLVRAGANEKALELYERALKISRKTQDKDDSAAIAAPAVSLQLKLGKNVQAERLANEFDLRHMLKRNR